MEADGHICAERAVVRDDIHQIRAKVMRLGDRPEIDAIITTGGTGFSGRDVTPEALEPLFQKRMEGFSVLFHQYSATTVGTSSAAIARHGRADRRRPSCSSCRARAGPAAMRGRGSCGRNSTAATCPATSLN